MAEGDQVQPSIQPTPTVPASPVTVGSAPQSNAVSPSPSPTPAVIEAVAPVTPTAAPVPSATEAVTVPAVIAPAPQSVPVKVEEARNRPVVELSIPSIVPQQPAVVSQTTPVPTVISQVKPPVTPVAEVAVVTPAVAPPAQVPVQVDSIAANSLLQSELERNKLPPLDPKEKDGSKTKNRGGSLGSLGGVLQGLFKAFFIILLVAGFSVLGILGLGIASDAEIIELPESIRGIVSQVSELAGLEMQIGDIFVEPEPDESDLEDPTLKKENAFVLSLEHPVTKIKEGDMLKLIVSAEMNNPTESANVATIEIKFDPADFSVDSTSREDVEIAVGEVIDNEAGLAKIDVANKTSFENGSALVSFNLVAKKDITEASITLTDSTVLGVPDTLTKDGRGNFTYP